MIYQFVLVPVIYVNGHATPLAASKENSDAQNSPDFILFFSFSADSSLKCLCTAINIWLW